MKKNYLQSIIVAIAVMLAMSCHAAPVDVAAARDRALHGLGRTSAGKLARPAGDVVLAHTETSAADAARADYYVFNTEDGGAFVIVAGDDRAPEVLAMGQGTLDVSQVPCNLKWLLGEYKRQMEYLMTLPEAPKRAPRVKASASPTVEPMLTSKWAQDVPYCNQCPTYNGVLCATGCTATAMAQVMYYWKYPDELPPLPAFVTSYLFLEVPALPGVQLDWDNMLDSYSDGYTAVQGAAVATLMRYCGQACFMDYNPDGSGAHQVDKLAGLMNFGYSSEAKQFFRDDIDSETWDAMLQEDLTAGRPVLYVGYSDGGGHSFVIDGCADGMYHVNWGWYGGYDGLYTLDLLGGSSWAFNYHQSMLQGVCPDESGEPKIVCDFEEDGIYYKKNGEEAAVVNKDYHFNSYQGVVRIPETVVHDGKTYPVTAIGDNAFRNCSELEGIVLPGSIKTIGDHAFRNCTALGQITIGRNVTSIGEGAFYECINLMRVDIEDVEAYCNIETKGFSSCPFNCFGRMYCDGQEVKNLVIPGSVQQINMAAFSFCPSIERVEIGDGVKRIGESAFYYCPSLRSLTIPASVEMVDYAAFCYCDVLEEINFLGDNLPMDQFVFYCCPSLKHVELPSGQLELPLATFAECYALERIDLGRSLRHIDYSAFANCEQLECIKIPETLAAIEYGAFMGCTSLKTVEAASLASWCAIEFRGENSNPVSLAGHLSIAGQPLQHLVVPEGVSDISAHAFEGCTDITSLTLSDGLVTVGEQAFMGCANLETVSVGKGVKTIGEKSFKDCSNIKTVDAASLAAWCDIEFKSETSNPVSRSKHLSVNGQPLQQLVVPDGVEVIGDYTFASCEDITDLIVPDGVTDVGNYAFYMCRNLETASLGDGVKTVGEKAFNICTSLKRLSLGKALESVKAKAFASCLNLAAIDCSAMTPPLLSGKDVFSNAVYKKATLSVPAAAIEAYKDTPGWDQFVTLVPLNEYAIIDVNRDGEVTVADVDALFNLIAGNQCDIGLHDLNGDGEVNIADVNMLIDSIINGIKR